MQILTLVAGWIVEVFLALLAGTILVYIWTKKISLNKLLSEANGDASLSRLQFLIFTFVISLSLFFVILAQPKGPGFPEIPAGIFALLGISASSYLVSKGIQYSNPSGLGGPALSLSPTTLQVAAGQAPTTFTAAVVNATTGTTLPAITWALDAPALGTIVPQPNGAIYTPGTGIAPGTKVTVRAQAAGFEDGTAIITY
jgi:hypothetical protein